MSFLNKLIMQEPKAVRLSSEHEQEELISPQKSFVFAIPKEAHFDLRAADMFDALDVGARKAGFSDWSDLVEKKGQAYSDSINCFEDKF